MANCYIGVSSADMIYLTLALFYVVTDFLH